jgi:hypothetical protein
MYTNARGRAMEEYTITRDLIIMNLDSNVPTFESSRVQQYTRTENKEVSCADHNIIFFEIDSRANGSKMTQHKAKRYLTKAESWGTFTHNLKKNLKRISTAQTLIVIGLNVTTK